MRNPLLVALSTKRTPKGRPKGFWTLNELTTLSGMSWSATREKMADLSNQGKLERTTVEIERIDGMLIKVPAYRLKR